MPDVKFEILHAVSAAIPIGSGSSVTAGIPRASEFVERVQGDFPAVLRSDARTEGNLEGAKRTKIRIPLLQL